MEIVIRDPDKEARFKEELKRAGYDCSDSAHYRLPRVVVSGVEGHMTGDVVLLALRTQNSEAVVAPVVVVLRSFESKGRPGLRNWVLQCSPEARRVRINMKVCSVGWARCRVTDYVRLTLIGLDWLLSCGIRLARG